MNATPLSASGLLHPDRARNRFRPAGFHLEVCVAVLLLVGANFTLLYGHCNAAFLFLPTQVAQGEWWRLLMHPWVHVSWYHLLLDATAFLILYSELRTLSSVRRIGSVLAAGCGSMVAALCLDPHIAQRGLCGLSGIAHGLMATAALETMRSGRGITFGLGTVSLLFVVAKCVIEAATGTVVFDFLHAGRIGSPVAVSHAGGVLGALTAWMLWSMIGRATEPRSSE